MSSQEVAGRAGWVRAGGQPGNKITETTYSPEGIPEEVIDRVLRVVCLLTTELPDPAVMACLSVCVRWRQALQRDEYRPWVSRLCCTQLAQDNTAARLNTMTLHQTEDNPGPPLLLSALWRQELGIAPDPVADTGQGIISPRMFSQAFMLHGVLHVVGGGQHDYAYEPGQDSWREVFRTDAQVFRFEASSGVWTHLPTSGELPVAHVYAAATAVLPKYLLIWLGGYYRRSYSSCYTLCTTDWRWEEVSLVSSAPELTGHPRFFAASCVVHQRLYAWGGRYMEGHGSGGECTEKYFNDLLCLDTSTIAATGQLRAATRAVSAHGEIPGKKFAASLTNVNDSSLVLFGGAQWVTGGSCQPDCTLHLFSLQSSSWSRLVPTDRVPRARLQHQTRVIGGGALLLVIGGYDGRSKEYLGPDDWAVMNLHTRQWVLGANYDPEDQPESGQPDNREMNFLEEVHEDQPDGWLCGRLPCARAGTAVAAMPAGSGVEITLFGGAQYVRNRWYRDLYQLWFTNDAADVSSAMPRVDDDDDDDYDTADEQYVM